MAFVNRKIEERQQDQAGAGELFEFDPADPTVVKVHYDLGAWTWDQRAELSEALAGADLPHSWDGEELIVPELVEGQVDALFERLEEELGPFPIVLEADAESTEFGLDEWTDADRAVLTESLVDSEVPFRWEGSTVVVARDAEDAVDDLLDAIEAGELLTADESPAEEPPDGALGSIFLAADRLARDPLDARARSTLIDLDPQIRPEVPPYAFAPRTWATAVEQVENIVIRIHQDSGDSRGAGDEEAPEVSELAATLRDLLRPFV